MEMMGSIASRWVAKRKQHMATKRHLSLLLLRQRVVIIIILLILLLQTEMEQQGHGGIAEAAQQEEVQHPPVMTRPGCQAKCGNVSIPFPFGIKPGCFLERYEVTCDESFDTGPRAFLLYNDSMRSYHEECDAFYSPGMSDSAQRSSSPARIELVDISIADSVVRVYGGVRSDCTTDGFNHTLKLQHTYLQDPFVLSPTRNVLIGVGWRVTPSVVKSLPGATGYGSEDHSITCRSDLTGNLQSEVHGGPCTGKGCCKTDLPGDVRLLNSFGVAFDLEKNAMNKTNHPCSYGMVVDRSWYNFSSEDVFNYEVLPNKFPRGVPMVLDFVIGKGGNCPTEKQSRAQQSSGYACQFSGNSYCTNSSLGGYTCNCSQHYHANPYIENGCIDINECEFQKQNPELNYYPCSSDGICKNRLRGYDCPCKRGMKGDGIKGTCREIFPIAAKVIVGIAALIIIFLLMVMARQFLKLKRLYERNGGQVLEGVKNIRIYTKRQLKKITNNYKRVIGEGHFGKVYIGTLENKQQVAIKKSIKVDKDRKKEFTDEVIIQSEMRHKNIARLLGCCLELDVPMLVYEFVARGSLYDVLFGHRDINSVDTRLRIAIGSAEGLTYMHSAGARTIRHGDVKSANILLDEDFNPKVSDFGTSSMLARGTAEKAELVTGDMSYIDPVYMEQGIVTQKSDVYSFGIVLIELITRRAATYDDKRSYVVNFVEACLDKRAREFFDNDITSQTDIELLEMVGEVVVDCVKPNPEERLDMKQVEHRLFQINGQFAQYGQESNYQGGLSPAPDDVVLLKNSGQHMKHQKN